MTKSIKETLKRVAQLNLCFGNPSWGDMGYSRDFKLIDYLKPQVSLIKEEMYDELNVAIQAGDEIGILDAIGDSITVIDGLAHKAGFGCEPQLACDVVGVIIEQTPFTVVVEDFMNLPRCVSDEEVERLAYQLWVSHRTFIEAFAIRRGYNPLAVYNEVHKSNMSKFCKTREEVEATLLSYQERFGLTSDLMLREDCHHSLPLPCDETGNKPTLVSRDLYVEMVNGLYIIKTCRDVMMGDKKVTAGKFLKGVNFVEPDFSDIERFKLTPLVL